jgi:DNA-binding Xre family transcriptional regulator
MSKENEKVRLRTEAIYLMIQEQELKLWWVAEATGVHRTTLRRWLSGEINLVRQSNVERLAGVLSARRNDIVE